MRHVQGYEAITLKTCSHASRFSRHFFTVSCTYQRLVCGPAFSTLRRTNHCYSSSFNVLRDSSSLASSSFSGREYYFYHKQAQTKKNHVCAALDVASAIDVINDLGLDTLTFLVVTVMIVPAFKIIKASPVSVAYTHLSLKYNIFVHVEI